MGGVVPSFVRLLELLKIDVKRLIPITSPIKFQNVILPDESFFLDDTGTPLENHFFSADAYFTREYLQTIEQIRNFAAEKFKPLEQKKFFFFHGTNQIGEERLAEYFKSKGYEIIKPEKFSLDEQLNILANCESFASTVGSCSHNLIFLRDGAEVILIPRWIKNKLNAYQQALNQLHELKIFYVDSGLPIYSPEHTGPYCYIISEQLKKFFGDDAAETYTEADFLTFLNYVKYALEHNLPLSETASKYCSNVMLEFMSQLRRREDLMARVGVKLS